MIRHIVETTGAKINVEDDGTVQIATSDGEAAKKAIEMIEGLTRVARDRRGVRRRSSGASSPTVPLSRSSPTTTDSSTSPSSRSSASRTSGTCSTEGDELKVRIIDIDANDRIKLSRRVILEDEARERGEDIPERDTSPPTRRPTWWPSRWSRTPGRRS